MTILLLVRHGRTTANASGVLAGRLPGVHLDDVGREQARRAGRRLAGVPLRALVSSPLDRCRDTAGLLGEELAGSSPGDNAVPSIEIDPDLAEVDYGSWSGRALRELAREDLWRTVQTQPSAVHFPGGESLAGVSRRAVACVRGRAERLADAGGPETVWLAVSHGDVIKAILADALGLHLDQFQRLVVGPASISAVRYTPERPYVLAMNTTAGAVADLLPRPEKTGGDPAGTAVGDDAVVGGGAGPTT